jgi:DNA-binding NarL/FixJ family response regulator
MQRSGGYQLIGPAIASRVLLELHCGELERARERASEGRTQLTGGEGNRIYHAEAYWLAIRVEAELAERARALADLDAVQRCEQEAVLALAEMNRWLATNPTRGIPPESAAFLALAEAELMRLRDERDHELWRAAAERFRSIGQIYPAAYADLRAAEALALAGARHSDVTAPLLAAHAVAVEVGSEPFLEEVAALARRTGVKLGDEPQLGVAIDGLGLTDRELEVLRLVADGRTNRQIGEQLFITPKTASVHVSRILMKLGAANRAEAAAAAHRLGLARPVEVKAQD